MRDKGSSGGVVPGVRLIRPRWRKVLADLWDGKVLTLLVVASIAVGVFGVGMIVSGYVIIDEDLRRSFKSINPANVLLVTDPLDEALLHSIRKLPAVADAEARRHLSVRVSVSVSEWDTLELQAIPDWEELSINRLVPLQGATAPGTREIILERMTMDSLGAEVGDDLHICLADGTERTLRVVGSALNPDIGYAGVLGQLQGYIVLETVEYLLETPYVNRLYVTAARESADRAHLDHLARQVIGQVERTGRQVYRTEVARSDEHPMASIIEALLGVLSALGVLVVALSGSLITNTMSTLLNRHLRHIGVMKLVGARRGQVAGMYLGLIMTYAALASLIAVPAGCLAGYWLARFAADAINFEVYGFRVVPSAVVLQLGIALLVPPAAGALPVLGGIRITVREALTGGSGLSQDGWTGRRSPRQRVRWLSRVTVLAVRNTFRRKGRLAITLLTLTLGGAVFMAVLNSHVALDHKVDRLAQYFLADVNVTLAQPYRIERVEREMMTAPGVQHVEPWTGASAEWLREGQASEPIDIIAPPAGSNLVRPLVVAGRWLLPDDQNAIALNDAIWKNYPDLQPGDSIRLRIAGRECDWIVVGIFQYAGMDQLLGYTNREYLSTLLGRPSQGTLFRIVTTEHDLATQKMVAMQLDEHLRSRGYRVAAVEAGGSVVESVSEVLSVLMVVLLIMSLLTALVGSIGLTGTMSMNVLERTREIGVLRAIGAHNGIIVRLVMVEGLLIGLISYVLAGIASFPLTAFLSNIISLAVFRSPAELAFTANGFVLWLGLLLLLSGLASLTPARHAARLTIREVLAYE